MRRIGVGLIGTGFMGKCHALAWNAVGPTFGDVARPRLVHLADATQALAEDRAAAFGFERASGDWRRVIEDAQVEVVSITAPNAFHAEMALAALEAGKHVWCEKPMATTLDDAKRMRDAARRSGTVAMLGYNYIQNPLVRHIRSLLNEGAIGTVNHVRIEMDEDFMADREAPFGHKDAAESGLGALDDFAVHPLSILHVLLGDMAEVCCDMARPYAERATAEGGYRAVETHDIANCLMRLKNGASGVLLANRAAHGRKGRIALQIYGDRGAIHYDQERFNEFQLYVADGRPTERGFRTVLAGPGHAPYGRFVPAPGHGLGFNDLKVIEARALLGRIAGEDGLAIGFEEGLRIERTVHAMAESARARAWVAIEG